jgi:hypothetical protein
MLRISASEKGRRFIGCKLGLKPTPGTILLDATADLDGVSTLVPGRDRSPRLRPAMTILR